MKPQIKAGYSIVTVFDKGGDRPVGVVRWDSRKEQYGWRFIDAEEHSLEILGDQLSRWAQNKLVPVYHYEDIELAPWTGEFWYAVKEAMSYNVKLGPLLVIDAQLVSLDHLFETEVEPMACLLTYDLKRANDLLRSIKEGSEAAIAYMRGYPAFDTRVLHTATAATQILEMFEEHGIPTRKDDPTLKTEVEIPRHTTEVWTAVDPDGDTELSFTETTDATITTNLDE